MENPVDKSVLTKLLKNKNNIIINNESDFIEYKSIFDWNNKEARAKYTKTVAAFSNNKGGYLIFGVDNETKSIHGVGMENLELDDANITDHLNNYLVPNIEFERAEFEINDNTLIIFYVYPSKNKPVLCIKNYDRILSESTIYYRYISKNDKIHYADLLNLINEVKNIESNKWMSLIQRISEVGVDNVNILNSKSGEIFTENNKFILNENLLSKLKVLDKYSENKEGSPAVRIIGNIEESGKIIRKDIVLNDNEIILAFLNNIDVHSPMDYVKAACYQSSCFLPIYYFLKKSKYNKAKTLRFLENLNKASATKGRIIRRIKNDESLYDKYLNASINTETSVGKTRKKLFKLLIEGKVKIESLNSGEVKRLLEAILNLKKGEYDSKFIKKIILDIFNNYYNDGELCGKIRDAVSFIDLIENGYNHD